jgi:tetratricopeptide (TPR) repeat protein
MSQYLLMGLIGLLYIVVFGGMALLRREGLSIRFASESICLTAIAVILVWLTPIQIHPVWFLLLLYIITLRVRILVDLANVFARRGNYVQAERIYDFASHLWPDQTSDLIIKVNHAILLLQKNQLNESISLFTEVLSPANQGYLGVKYEAAAHFNLGVAYLRINNNSMATEEFNSVLDTWPASRYAQRAQQALESQRTKTTTLEENNPVEK